MSSPVPYVNSFGREYIQIWQRVPFGEYFYTPFEKNFLAGPGLQFAKTHPMTPVAIVVAYMVLVFGGQRIMRDRKPFGLINSLALWNFFLSSFSLAGACRTVPHLIHNLLTRDMSASLCTNAAADWGDGATGLWVQLFVFSKVPELVDTAFIVLRKKPLIFLHWYHHITVLAYCWHAYATLAPQALYFVAMNYSVHAVMYGYYCLMALRMKPKWLPPIVITLMQLSQMVVGTAVQIASMVKYYTADEPGGAACPVNKENMIAGGIMYASYFALFFKFMIERFVLDPRKKAQAKKLADKVA